MTSYVLRRLVQSIPVLIGLSIIVFGLMHIIPGGPAYALLGHHASPAQIALFNRNYGLNKPIPIQYGIWVWGVIHGNLGDSIAQNAPVIQVMGDALPHTLDIVVPSIIIADVIAIFIGVLQAQRHDSVLDHVLTTVSFILWSMPTFWLGIILIIQFAINIHWFPSGGISDPIHKVAAFPGYVQHTTLPVAALVLVTFAQWARYMRSSMMDTMVQDYVRTARAKGLTNRMVVYKHALRNSLLPLITLLGLSLPFLFTGALVIEVVFNYPGLGLLFYNSALDFDYPVCLAIVMAIGVLTILGNLLADVLYALVDPRIQYG